MALDMLDIATINQSYGSSHILRDVSFSVPKGACTVLLGRNGVGNTILLRAIMGVVPVRSGTISFDGQDITNLPPYARAARGMAYVPQGREIFARLTVEENILMGMATKSGKAARTIPTYVYEMFPVLKTMLNGVAAICRAGSNSSWRLPAPWSTQPADFR